MSVKMKFCGINSRAAFAAATAAGADWIGLVFFPPSPRFVTPAQAATLASSTGAPALVGLFVNPSPPEIAAVLDVVPLSALQIYGADAQTADLRQRFGLPVWRAVGIASAAELPQTLGAADALVIEPQPPPGATR